MAFANYLLIFKVEFLVILLLAIYWSQGLPNIQIENAFIWIFNFDILSFAIFSNFFLPLSNTTKFITAGKNISTHCVVILKIYIKRYFYSKMGSSYVKLQIEIFFSCKLFNLKYGSSINHVVKILGIFDPPLPFVVTFTE